MTNQSSSQRTEGREDEALDEFQNIANEPESPEAKRMQRFITPPNMEDEIISETSISKEDYSEMCVKYTKFLLKERAKTKKMLDN